MFKLYGKKKAARLIAQCQPQVHALEERFGIPAAALNAILNQEIPEIDLWDMLADQAVLLYWRAARLFERPPRVGKRDSSTGYAQVFASTAIDALNFASEAGIVQYRQLGILVDHRLSRSNWADLRMIWMMLHKNIYFNLLCAALALLSAAQEMTGRIGFDDYTAEEWQLIFTRYNADVKEITAYGRKAYAHFTQGV